MLFGGVSCQTDTGTKEPTHNSIDNKFIASNTSNDEVLVERTDTLSLKILYPRFNKVDLACGTMPSQSDTVPTTRKSSNSNIFRALCQLDGKLCVIESDSTITFGAFKSRLMALKVSEALYTDMGSGWNHAWYRVSNDSVNILHPKKHNYCTNGLHFTGNDFMEGNKRLKMSVYFTKLFLAFEFYSRQES